MVTACLLFNSLCNVWLVADGWWVSFRLVLVLCFGLWFAISKLGWVLIVIVFMGLGCLGCITIAQLG